MYEVNDPQQPAPSPLPPALPPGASPHAVPYAVPTLGYALPGSIQPYRPARGRANWVIGLLVAFVIVSLVSLLSSYWQLDLLNRADAGEEISQEEASANDLRELAVSVVGVGLYIATVVVFLMWLHRARKNLESLGAHGAQYSPGWAIGAWFVPILNLFRPYQIVQEVYKGSIPQRTTAPDDTSWQVRSGSALIGWWWAAWIISALIDRVSFRLSRNAEEIPELIAATRADIVAIVAGTVAAFFCIAVVRQVTACQEETASAPATPI